MAPVHISLGPEPILLTLGQISSGLVPNHVPVAPYVPPTNKHLEILFQLMFDEYFEPSGVERLVPPTPAVQVLVVLADTPSSMINDQDAPLTSYSPLSSIVQHPISHQGIVAGPTIEDSPFAQADNNLFVNVFGLEPSLDESSMSVQLNLHKLFTCTIISENGPSDGSINISWGYIWLECYCSISLVFCYVDRNAGNDDNLMFTVRGLPNPASWLGDHTDCVIAAMAGD
uniref:Uncharacterized protein n=1 Tax=Tanacetum cinerariifolium TaxID=118510 RepID=A0A6L2NNF2_TANCI|nr:hypothetical protein [Tanacetum cinerariifolium]